MFEVAEAYEAWMGRWSRQLAPLFVEIVGVQEGEKVLDAGCGTGSLSATLARVTGASKIGGIDPSKDLLSTREPLSPIDVLVSTSGMHKSWLTLTDRLTDA
jgi:ubiquinone/menaquinone biosynthesis C-methylase UbiE